MDSTWGGGELQRGDSGVDKETDEGKEGATAGKILGLDVGHKRIGVALSDELGWTAQPYTTLGRKGLAKDLSALREIVEREGVAEIVVGLPRNMNGSEGPQARKARRFAEEVRRALGLPVVEWDERLSSVAAERVLIEADVSRKKRRGQVDKLAAVLILQGYLDSDRGGGGEAGSGVPGNGPAVVPPDDGWRRD